VHAIAEGAIDKTMKDDPQFANDEADQITLEHMLPWNPGPEWDSDEETAQAAQRSLATWSSCALTRMGRSATPRLAEKRNVYRDSSYSVTNQVANYAKWTMDEIRNRQAQLAKIAVKTWSQSFAD
jgi:hypothetical protein